MELSVDHRWPTWITLRITDPREYFYGEF